jgi:hypothetical protein
MKDEEYVFRQDSVEKAVTARSARHRRTHNGKGGRVKFPSDYLTKKELKAMSGSVESYRLNDPMKWDEFKKMPDDLKRDYIKLIRERFNVPDRKIADMMDVHPITLSNFLKTLGCNKGIHYSKKLKFDEGGWYAWVNGMPMPEKEEPPVTEAIPEEPPVIEEPKAEEPKVTKAIPNCGTMTFEGKAEDIANTLVALLGGAKVHIGIQWDVLED